MPPAPRPSNGAQRLLLRQLGSMVADKVRDLMRSNSITGLSNNKPVLIEKVQAALRDGEISWHTLIAFLDANEPNGKQRVQMLKAPTTASAQYSASTLKAALEAHGSGGVWGAEIAVAAPEELELSSVKVSGTKLVIVAIGRRTYRERVRELEATVDLPRAGLEVQLYEHVEIRGWGSRLS